MYIAIFFFKCKKSSYLIHQARLTIMSLSKSRL